MQEPTLPRKSNKTNPETHETHSLGAQKTKNPGLPEKVQLKHNARLEIKISAIGPENNKQELYTITATPIEELNASGKSIVFYKLHCDKKTIKAHATHVAGDGPLKLAMRTLTEIAIST